MEIVNSCENNNGGCSHHCEHSTSGPVCSCNNGYRLDDDLKTCVGKKLQCSCIEQDMMSTDNTHITHVRLLITGYDEPWVQTASFILKLVLSCQNIQICKAQCFK